MADPAYAYRPFTLTDASVAARRDLELECGPIGFLVDADGRFLIAPSVIVNFGVGDGSELVLEGRQFFRVQGDNQRFYTLRDTALSVKHILRQGSLQNDAGPSVGLEGGVLLPGVGSEHGVGASIGGVVSHRWPALTVHVNGAFSLTQQHRMAALGGVILEGPTRWKTRPVAEVLRQHEEARTESVLLGGIWTISDNLSLDAGWLMGRSRGHREREFRAGFTWAVPLASCRNARLSCHAPRSLHA